MRRFWHFRARDLTPAKSRDLTPAKSSLDHECEEEQVTVVFMAHDVKRAKENLPALYKHYAAMSELVCECIVVWNNPTAELPIRPRSDGKVRFTLVLNPEPSNSLNNRWKYAALHAKTRAVLTVDDDRLPSASAVQCLLAAWRLDKQRIVGIDARRVKPYSAPPDPGPYNIVLTGTTIIDAQFPRKYMEQVEVLKYVDDKFNCEDIAMNAVVQRYWRKPPLRVMGAHIREMSKSGSISRRPGHYEVRHQCASWLERHFNITFPVVEKAFSCSGLQGPANSRNS